jgi:GDPmannose 4,6-dehydratase
VRDWGWAPDYAEAMLRMSELEQPTELILATGRSVSLRTAIASLVCAAGLEWDEAIAAPDARLSHHAASDEQHADPSRAMDTIGWTGSTPFPGLAAKLISEPR